MDNRIKNYFGLTAILSMVVLIFSAVSLASSYAQSIDHSRRSFSVSGEGKVVAIPDVAEFTFSVITEGGRNIEALLQENAAKVNRAIEFVKGQGVDPKDIRTQAYRLEPRYTYYYDRKDGVQPPPEIVGYTITQSVRVKVKDFAKLGDLVSGVIENGANSIGDLSFRVDDPVKLQNEALTQAIAEAKNRALATAKAGGFRLGRLISLEENIGSVPPFYAFGRGGYADAEMVREMPAPVIEPGSEEITVQVVLRYEIR